jgi:hypothetical protein
MDMNDIKTERHFYLPHIGQRIVKTSIAVFITLLVYYLRGYRGAEMPAEAAITAIICMQPYVRDTRDFAVNRFIGTLIGAAWGLAFLLLMAGSALAITWFHADVNMMDAQQALFRFITGHQAENEWLITGPYAAGVFFGVSLFYALLGKRRSVAPLEIKLEEYRQAAEQVSGLTP